MERRVKVLVLTFVLLAFLSGCGKSEFEKMYNETYAAYLSADIKVAESSLRAFDEYLKARIDAEETLTAEHFLIESRIVTNIRMYDIFNYDGNQDEAGNSFDVIDHLLPAHRSMEESDVLRLLEEIQRDHMHRPRWKN